MVEKLKLYLLLLIRLLLVFFCDYMHLYAVLTKQGHFLSGGGLMLGLFGIREYLKSQKKQMKI